MRVKSTLIELYKRVIDFDKGLSIYNNGENNEYPERIERLINNSVTAKQCANTMSAFLAGKGFEGYNDFKVGNQTLLRLLHKASYSVSRQRGIFFHVNYNLNAEITSLEVLPYSHCRIGKQDDNKYNGKIAVCEDWSDTRNNPTTLIDVYNPNKKVIQSQIESQGIDDYKGQVLFVNLDYNTLYPYSTIDAVQNDCDSESQASIYKNRSLRKGFFGKTLVITRPLVDANPEDDDYHIQDNERRNFKRTIKSFIGAENTDGVLHLEMEFDNTEGIDKSIKFETIETNIDDKLFQFTEDSTANNIRFAFNNIPAMLVRANDGQMFGQSGEGIKEAKLFYLEQTTMERMVIVEVITQLMQKFKGFEGELQYKPLIEDNGTID